MDYSTLQMCTIAVKAYIEQRKKLIIRIDFFEILCDGIASFLEYWVGNTYVGNKKTSAETAIFQDFFRSLSSLIALLQDEKICPTQDERDLVSSLVYHGKVYRYLGYPSPTKKKHIEPIYNDIFVSWSKNKEISYIESKLYGCMTRLYCNIPPNMVGFDLEGFQEFYNNKFASKIWIARGEEREVVFPTIKEMIYRIEYF